MEKEKQCDTKLSRNMQQKGRENLYCVKYVTMEVLIYQWCKKTWLDKNENFQGHFVFLDSIIFTHLHYSKVQNCFYINILYNLWFSLAIGMSVQHTIDDHDVIRTYLISIVLTEIVLSINSIANWLHIVQYSFLNCVPRM